MANYSEVELQEHFDNFFEDVFVELEDKVNHCCSLPVLHGIL